MNKLRIGLDLGTTSLAGRLWNGNGQQLAEATIDNPQQAFGADVIVRMAAAQQGAAAQLQRQLIGGINRLLEQLLERSGCRWQEIGSAAAAANPAISHFLAGQSIERILYPPHRPNYSAGELLDSAGLGLELPVPLYLLPLVSGYIGGDLLALLLGSPPAARPTLYIDLGTNAELALWDGATWLATSVAAGPAFEAGNLDCGMRYVPGAVADVKIINAGFALTPVGSGVPKGICGSGLFALIDAALQAGLIAADGRIKAADEVDSNLSRYLLADGAGNTLQFYRDARTCLRISQSDVRAFQLAKGAVLAGVTCLLQRAGLAPEQLESVRIAGALGGALPVAALKGVAMLPEIVLDRCRFLAGGVLDGLLVLLQGRTGAEAAEELAVKLKVYPLSGTPAFEKAFLASLDF